MGTGKTVVEFAGAVDVSEDTLYEWAKKHPEFSESIKRGRAKLEMYYMRQGRLGIAGNIPGFNSTAFIWITKNALKWSDRVTTRDETKEKFEDRVDEELQKEDPELTLARIVAKHGKRLIAPTIKPK
jgi:hypothetical protein